MRNLLCMQNWTRWKNIFEELIIDYLTGNLSDPDIARFLEFVQSDERHRRRFEELSRLYAQSLIPRFETDKKARYREAERRIAASRRRPSFWRIAGWTRVAAALLVGIVVGAASLFVLRLDAEPGLCEVTVPAGARSQIMLPDSSPWYGSMPVLNLYMPAISVVRTVGCDSKAKAISRLRVMSDALLPSGLTCWMSRCWEPPLMCRLTPMPGPSRSICSKVAWR